MEIIDYVLAILQLSVAFLFVPMGVFFVAMVWQVGGLWSYRSSLCDSIIDWSLRVMLASCGIACLATGAFIAIHTVNDHDLWCRKGHYEDRIIPAHRSATAIPTGKSIIVVPRYVPEHVGKVWVCDEAK